MKEERDALHQRYSSAKTAATDLGTISALDEFERAVSGSQAVLARSVNEVHRLATSDKELYATYYQLNQSGIRLPEGNKWDILRGVADSALFPNFKENIRFAALSIDSLGLTNYGECSILFREDMIAHRTSVFEENSILFMKHHSITVWSTDELPKGYRATWGERHKLCLAKLSERISEGTTPDVFSQILMRQGANAEDDEFVEVHIWGPVTVRTMERVTLTGSTKPKQPQSIIRALKERLENNGVEVVQWKR